MEKHKCKLCFRNFANGRALGGHMRSHMMNLPKPNESPRAVQLSFEAESSSSFENDVVDKGGGGLSLSYGLRENPKRSFRFVDPEFLDAGSVILQDRESETESSRNPTRRRSRNYESASSASDTTTEEDVAFCLMMLSRDRWKRQRQNHELMMEEEQEEEEEEEEQYEEEEEEEEEEDSEDDESEEEEEEEEVKPCKANTRVRGGRYKCDTCNKVFRSYQALGGHRASHKKIKVVVEEPESEHENNNNNNNNGDQGGSSVVPEKKIHECPVCFRVFASGQALGGHKRTHVIGSTATATATATVTIAAATNATTEARSSAKLGDSTLIDLNLPAPMDDDDASQIEDSAVSDAEFVKSR